MSPTSPSAPQVQTRARFWFALTLPVWVSLSCNGRVRSDSTGANTPASAEHSTLASADLSAREPLLAVGELASCVVDSAGRLWCWGDAEANRPDGRPGKVYRIPRQIPVPSPVRAVDVGREQACAIGADRRAWCWSKGYQQRRSKQGPAERQVPQPISGTEEKFVAIAVGQSEDACAITDAATLWCWGRKEHPLGIGLNQAGPAPAIGIAGAVIDVAVGRDYVLAVTGDGGLWLAGALPGFSHSPQPVGGFVHLAAQFTRVFAEGSDAFALDRSQRVLRWVNGQFEAFAGLAPGVLEVSGSRSLGCAVMPRGAVSCWGYGHHGVLANGGLINAESPVLASKLPPMRQVAIGNEHGCGFTVERKLMCWGNDDSGLVGANQRGILEPTEVVLGAPNGGLATQPRGRHLKAPNPTEPVPTFEELLDVRDLACEPAKEALTGQGELWSVKGKYREDEIEGELLRVADDVFVRFAGARKADFGAFAGKMDTQGRVSLVERIDTTPGEAAPRASQILTGSWSASGELRAEVRKAHAPAGGKLQLATTGTIGEIGKFTRYNALRGAAYAEQPSAENPVAYVGYSWLEVTIDRRAAGMPKLRVLGWAGGTSHGWCEPGATLTSETEFIGEQIREWEPALRKLLAPQTVLATHFFSLDCERAWSREQASIFTQDPKYGLVETRFEISSVGGINYALRQCVE